MRQGLLLTVGSFDAGLSWTAELLQPSLTAALFCGHRGSQFNWDPVLFEQPYIYIYIYISGVDVC